MFLATAVWALGAAVPHLGPAYQLERLLAEEAGRGYPTTMEELAACYPLLPPGQNGAGLIREAGRVVDELKSGGLWPAIIGQSPVPEPPAVASGEDLALVRGALAHSREALALSHRARQHGALRFDLDLHLGAGLDISHHNQMHHLVALHMVEAAAAVHDGQEGHAADAVATATWLIEALRHEPTHGASNARLRMWNTVYSYLPYILSHGRWSDGQLSAVAEAVARVRLDRAELLRSLAIHMITDARSGLVASIDGQTVTSERVVSQHTVDTTRQWTETLRFAETAEWCKLAEPHERDTPAPSGIHLRPFAIGREQRVIAAAMVEAMRRRLQTGHWPTRPADTTPYLTYEVHGQALTIRSTLPGLIAYDGVMDSPRATMTVYFDPSP